jgi:hypothetical protein
MASHHQVVRLYISCAGRYAHTLELPRLRFKTQKLDDMYVGAVLSVKIMCKYQPKRMQYLDLFTGVVGPP